jgi:hypothetical protein
MAVMMNDDSKLAHIVGKTMDERTEDIQTYLMSGQLKSMDEYAALMGEVKFIAHLEDEIREANKENEEDELYTGPGKS